MFCDLVGEISASHALPKEVIEGVNERTGGICLGFIVQLQNHALFRRDHGRVTIVIEKAWASLGVGVLGPWL